MVNELQCATSFGIIYHGGAFLYEPSGQQCLGDWQFQVTLL